jgi:anti-anti-sigma factor
MPSVPASFAIEPLPDGVGFRLAGELDLATAPELGAALQSAGPGDGVVLDAEELTFIDSSGWSVLVDYVRGHDGTAQLTIVNATPAVVRSLELMGLREHPRIELRPADDL